MGESGNAYRGYGGRVRSALMVFCAVVLFLAGLLLLLAPAGAENSQSRIMTLLSPSAGTGG